MTTLHNTASVGTLDVHVHSLAREVHSFEFGSRSVWLDAHLHKAVVLFRLRHIVNTVVEANTHSLRHFNSERDATYGSNVATIAVVDSHCAIGIVTFAHSHVWTCIFKSVTHVKVGIIPMVGNNTISFSCLLVYLILHLCLTVDIVVDFRFRNVHISNVIVCIRRMIVITKNMRCGRQTVACIPCNIKIAIRLKFIVAIEIKLLCRYIFNVRSLKHMETFSQLLISKLILLRIAKNALTIKRIIWGIHFA